MVKQLQIQWQQVKGFPHASVRRIEFCCPAMAENWNRITQFVRHPPSQEYKVVSRTEIAAATLQAAAVSHAAAVTAEEATGMGDADFDYQGEVDYSRVFPWKCCPHCGAMIIVEQIHEVRSDSADGEKGEI